MGGGAHGTLGCAGFLMLLAAIGGGISITTAWWANSGDTVVLTLWHTEMKMWGEYGIKAKHDDMCDHSTMSDQLAAYCDKMRAARAMAILTAVFSLGATVLFFATLCKNRVWMVYTGITFTALSIAISCAGLGLGIMLNNDNSIVDKPREGWIGICIAALMSLIAFILANIGMCLGPQGSSSLKPRRPGRAGFGGHPGAAGYGGYGNRPPVGHQQANPQGYPQGYPHGHPMARQGGPASLAPPSWPAAGSANVYGQMPSPVGSPRPAPGFQQQPAPVPVPSSYGQSWQGAAPPAGYGAQPGYSVQASYAQPSTGQAQQSSPRPGDFGIQPIQQANMPPLPKTLDYY